MNEHVLIGLAATVFLGVSAQWIAWRISLPSILLLLLFGVVVGPVAGWLDPDHLAGDMLLPFVSISVALILYEGGLTLRFSELPAVGAVIMRLVTLGALITGLIATFAARLCFHVDWGIAALLGAIFTVTGPTVIGPLLRQIRPAGASGRVLKWEGIIIDPIGALLAVLVFEILVSSGHSATNVFAVGVVRTVLVGGGLGLVGAGLLTLMLARYWIPDFLQNAVSLMLVIVTHVAANHMQDEAGLFAVTVMGIALANQRFADVKHIVEFKENLRVLLISTLFILLSARLELSDLFAGHWWSGPLFVTILVGVARPLSVFAATMGNQLKPREKWFIAAMAPRGIVAAAVASIFALRLEEAGYPDAGVLVPITFMTIIGTVAIYGLSSPWVAQRLGVADRNPQGILFVGAAPWVRSLAKVLSERGYATRLIDNNRGNITAARMAGLPAFHGSALGEHLLDDLDLGGIGRLFAMTPNDWVNALACQRFNRIFGVNHCYQLPPRIESGKQSAQHKHLHGRWLFAENANYPTLGERFARGGKVKATRITDEFTLDDFYEHNGKDAIPLMMISEQGSLQPLTPRDKLDPQPGQTIVALVNVPDEP